MLEKTFKNNVLEIELTSYIESKQNVWFKGKDIAKILKYVDTDQASRKNVSEKYKNSYLVCRGVRSEIGFL